jgi:hypothetical protein
LLPLRSFRGILENPTTKPVVSKMITLPTGHVHGQMPDVRSRCWNCRRS